MEHKPTKFLDDFRKLTKLQQRVFIYFVEHGKSDGIIRAYYDQETIKLAAITLGCHKRSVQRALLVFRALPRLSQVVKYVRGNAKEIYKTELELELEREDDDD